MDKVFEKFGVYDIVGVLLPGICIVTFSDMVLQFVYNLTFNIQTQINGTVAFLIISYFCGLVFQEMGSGIQKKIIHRNNYLLKEALQPKDDDNVSLTATEKEGVFTYIKDKLKLDTDDYVIIYNYCKFYCLKNNKMTRMDKDQSISAMSRSLSLYFLTLMIAAILSIERRPEMITKILVLIDVSLFFLLLLYYRMKRFAKIRYINIVRTFYYDVVAK